MPALKSILIFLLFLIPADSLAQVQFGIYLDRQQTESLSDGQLQQFQSTGISLLAPEGFLSTTLQTDFFRVMPSLPLAYITPRSAILRNESIYSILDRYNLHYLESRQFETTGIIAGRHPDLKSSRVQSFYQSFRNRLPDTQLFLITGLSDSVPSGFSPIADAGKSSAPGVVTEGIILLASHHGPNAVRNYAQEIRTAAAQGYSTFLLEKRDYDFLMNEEHYGAELLYAFGTQPAATATVPLPALSPESPALRADVIILLLLWLSFSIHFRFNPNYTRTVVRFFASYSFMVEDILRRHIIMGSSTIIMFMQVMLLWGLVLYSTFNGLLGTGGFEALTYHLPFLFGSWSVFIIAVAAGALFNFISLFWLVSCCYRQDIFSQSATLYLWPMHLGFPITTVLVTLSVLLPGSPLILILCGLFLLLNLVSFYVAAAAFGREPTLSPAFHFLATSVLYSILLGLFGFLIYSYTDIFHILLLAWRVG